MSGGMITILGVDAVSTGDILGNFFREVAVQMIEAVTT